MNILITNAVMFMGGVEAFAIKLGKGLTALGHNVTFAIRTRSRMEEELARQRCDAVSVPMTGDVDPVSLARLRKIMTSRKIDVVCTTCPRDFRLAGIVSSMVLRKGVVFTMGTVWDPQQPDIPHNFKYYRAKLFFDFALQKGIANSRGGKEYVSRAWSIPDEKLDWIYNGVDLSIFDPEKIRTSALRVEYHIPESATAVSLVARISSEKGQLHFLGAAREILQQFPKTYFLVVGESTNDGYFRRVRNLWEGIERNDQVIFTGFRNDIQNILAGTDILVLPSSQEGLPNVVLEAMAMKIPVIASDVCATNEAVRNGENGFLISPPADHRELTARIEELLVDDHLREEMGKNGRRLIEERFDLADNIRQYEKVFASLC